MLRYIQNSKQKNILDDLTMEIDTFVRRLKENAEVRKHYMWAHEREQILIQDAQDEIQAEKDKVIAEKDSVIAKEGQRSCREKQCHCREEQRFK